MGKYIWFVAPRIHFLPDECINQIAAGEVVERPASVVKELAENALDAGARRISVEIAEGGKALAKVSDDGCGISREDVGVCALRHTTSKISAAGDIVGVRTNGFRGEALASIASVARLRIQTRTEEEEAGSELLAVPGREPEIRGCARERGTTVEVEDLFLNAPVRARFLSSPAAETARVLDVVQRLALANPDVAFRLRQGNRDLLVARPGDLALRVREILDPEIARNLLPVEWEEDGVRVSGYVGNERTLKARRTHQFLFAGRRPIWNAALFRAVAQGAEALHGNPAAVLFLDLPPEDVDVNVHPAKREVRFARESRLFEIAVHAVRNALARRVEWVPAEPAPDAEPAAVRPAGVPEAETEKPAKASAFPAERPAPRGLSAGRTAAAWKDFAWRVEEAPKDEIKALSRDLFAEAEEREKTLRMPERDSIAGIDASESRVVPGNFLQIGEAYIAAPYAGGLLLVDQRAAHQRILFEQARLRMQRRENRSQQLLFPELLELSPAQSHWVGNSLASLALIGFEVEHFGANSWQLRATPPGMTVGNAVSALKGMADDAEEESPERGDADVADDFCDRLALSFAKKASIDERALAPEEIQALVDDLFATENPYVAPDGSSVVVKLALDEIRDSFRRKGPRK